MSAFKKTARAYLNELLRRMRSLSINLEKEDVCFGYEDVFDAFVGASFEVKGIDVVDAARVLGNAVSSTEGIGRIPFITKRVERTWRMTTVITGIFYNHERRVDGEVAEIVFTALRQLFYIEESETMVLANAEVLGGSLFIVLAPKDGCKLPHRAWFKETAGARYIDACGGEKPRIFRDGNFVTIKIKHTTRGGNK